MIDEYLRKVDESRVVGPFPPRMVPGVHVNHFGTTSAKHIIINGG